MKPILTLICCIIFIHYVIVESKGGGHLCPGVPNCYCYRSDFTKVSIYCHNVDDLAPLTNLFETQPTFKVVTLLKLSECGLTNLTSGCFQDIALEQLNTDCPFDSMENNVFDKPENLTKLIMTNTAFTELPDEICKLKNLRTLTMKYHFLKRLNCKFPGLYNISLVSGLLEEISNDTFASSTGLRYIDFTSNKLITIDQDAFESTKVIRSICLKKNGLVSLKGLFKAINPQELILAENNLTHLDNAFHVNMWQLKVLDMSRNPIGKIQLSVFGNNTPNIKILDLSHTNQHVFYPDIFRTIPVVEEIEMSYNHLQTLPGGLFRDLEELRVIRIASSSLQFIANAFVNLPNLELLDLSRNKIRTLSQAFANLSKLGTLEMNDNRIIGVIEGDLDGVPALKTLDISFNQIAYISKSSFSKLQNLRTLYMRNNIFFSLNNSVQNLESLEKLYIQSGRLKEFGYSEFKGLPNLMEVNMSDNDIVEFGELFRPLVRLKSLNIAHNRATTLRRNSLPENLILTALQMAGNPWHCDCRFSWLVDWLNQTSMAYLLDNPVCETPSSLAQKPLQNLSFDDLNNNVENCPSACKCGCVSSVSSAIVNCTAKNMSVVPTSLPLDLGILDMSSNLLTNLLPFNPSYFTSLRELNLANNSISHMNVSLPASLRILKLNRNNFVRAPLQILSFRGLAKVMLSNNPWVCDCQTLEFYLWLTGNESLVADVENVRCAGGNMDGKPIVHLTKNDLCPSHLDIKYKTICIIVGSVAAAVLLLVILCCVSLAVRAWFYSIGFRCLKRKDKEQNKLYDGILLYTTADKTFALETIAAGLETEHPKFTLFIPSAATGGDRSNLMGAIAMCSRVIVIFSEDFIRDHVSMDNLSTAFKSFQHPPRLIIIQYGYFPAQELVDGLARSISDLGFLVRWGEFLFWKKLKYLMPKTSKSVRAPGVQNTDSEPLMS